MDLVNSGENIDLDNKYWDERYLNGKTGWDMHQASPPLTEYIDTLAEKDIRILIPGCGNAYEATYLLNKGFRHVTLIDISKVLTERLTVVYRDKPVKIKCENFVDHIGVYDLILEQTFLCALRPTLRKSYIEKCARLLSPSGKIAGVLFNKPLGRSGPPFTTTDQVYKRLFSEKFQLNIYEECYNSIIPRKGSEVFFEAELL